MLTLITVSGKLQIFFPAPKYNDFYHGRWGGKSLLSALPHVANYDRIYVLQSVVNNTDT